MWGVGGSLVCHCQVDFDSLVAWSEGEQRRQEEEERRTRLLIEQRLATVQKEMKGIHLQILCMIFNNVTKAILNLCVALMSKFSKHLAHAITLVE